MTALLRATCLDGEKTLTVCVSTVVSVRQSKTLMCLQNIQQSGAVSGAQWPLATLALSPLEGAWPSIVVVFGFPRTKGACPLCRVLRARRSLQTVKYIGAPNFTASGASGAPSLRVALVLGSLALGLWRRLAFEIRLDIFLRRRRSSFIYLSL